MNWTDIGTRFTWCSRKEASTEFGSGDGLDGLVHIVDYEDGGWRASNNMPGPAAVGAWTKTNDHSVFRTPQP